MNIAVALGRCEFFLQVLPPLVGDPVGLLARDAPLLEQVVEISLAYGFALVDSLVEQGLSESRFVRLVMATAAVSVHVDNDVAPVFVTEIHRQAHSLSRGFGILPVDVQDRNLEHLGNA